MCYFEGIHIFCGALGQKPPPFWWGFRILKDNLLFRLSTLSKLNRLSDLSDLSGSHLWILQSINSKRM